MINKTEQTESELIISDENDEEITDTKHRNK